MKTLLLTLFLLISTAAIAKSGHVSINQKNAEGETPLLTAAANGDMDTVKSLLAKGANPNLRDSAGETPLLQAISGGNSDMALLLIRKGTDLKFLYDDKQQSILFEAARKGDVAVIKALLKKRPALLNQKDKDGETALFAAVRASQNDSVVALVKAGAHKDEKNNAGKKAVDLADPKIDQKVIQLIK